MTVKSNIPHKVGNRVASKPTAIPAAKPAELPHDVLPTVFYPKQGALIAAARQRAGMTQEQLATAVGQKRASITHVERGTQKPLPHTLVLMADVLKVELTELFPPSLAETRDLRATLDALPSEVRDKIEKHMPSFPRARS